MLSYKIGKIEDLSHLYESYAAEFPADERKSMAQLRALMSGGKYHLILFEDKGFACVYADVNALNQRKKTFVWLDYLVIHRAYQGQGYGSIFFNRLLEIFHQASIMFIEVEIPDGVDVNRDRRIRYYERLGAKRLPIQYALPIENGALPMYLYAKYREDMLEDEASRANLKNLIGVDDDLYEAIFEVFQYVHYDHLKLNEMFALIKLQCPNFEAEMRKIFV